MAKKLLFFCSLCFLQIPISFSQGYAGKDFWVSFMDWDYCQPFAPYRLDPPLPTFYYDTTELFLSSEYATRVIIEIGKETFASSGLLEDYADTVYLIPHEVKYVFLPIAIMNRWYFTDLILNNGVHIRADSNIFVKAVNRAWLADPPKPPTYPPVQLKEATALLPSTSIPFAPEYIITTNESTGSWDCLYQLADWEPGNCSEFTVVGIAPHSEIEINPVARNMGPGTKAGKPIIIHLQAGQTYTYVASNDKSSGFKRNLSGTILKSKTAQSKFAVFAGNKNSFSTLKNKNDLICGNKNHLYEQLIPVSSWGKSYTALPFMNNPGGYILKIMTSQDKTAVFINGKLHQNVNIHELLTLNINSDSITQITANHPISVMQFSKAGLCAAHPAPKTDFGNLSMLQLYPDNQMDTLCQVNYCTQVQNWWGGPNSANAPEFYSNVLVHAADTAAFLLDGFPLPDTAWQRHALIPQFAFAQIPLDSVSHTLYSRKGFLAYAYGYAKNEGFSYTANGRNQILNNRMIYNKFCKEDTTEFTALLLDAYEDCRWQIEGASTVLSGLHVRYVFPDTGTYKVQMISKHKLLNTYDTLTAYLKPQLADQRPVIFGDTLICGQVGFTSIPYYFDYFKSYLWNGGHPFLAQYIKNPGMYWVKVTERSGCSFIDTSYVSSTPRPLANFSISDSTLCSNFNKKITFANTSTSYDSIINSHWDFDDFNPIDTTLDTLYHLFPRVGQHFIQLRVKTNRGCEDDTFTVVEILQAPKAQFSVFNVDSCLNSNRVSFINQTLVDTALHRWFKWYFSEGYVISRNNPAGPRTYDSAGLFFAHLIYEHKNGCLDTMKRPITIYENPKADFKNLAAVSCQGDSVYFLNRSISKQGPYQSFWHFGNSNTSTLTHPVYLFPGKGQYPVSLKVLSPQACADSIVLPVYISGNTKADFSLNDSEQCLSGHVFRLQNRSVSDTGLLVKSTWTFDDGTSSFLLDSVSKTYLKGGAYTIRLRVENNFSCADSLEKTVYVYNPPSGEIRVNNRSQCEDAQDFDFSFWPEFISDSIRSYTWYYMNNLSHTGKNLPDIQFPKSGTHTVRIHTVSEQGCRDSSQKTVFVNPAPVARFVTNQRVQCFSGHAFQFSNQSTLSQGKIQTSHWEFGDNSSSSLSNPGPKKYANGGIYSVLLQLESDSGCQASAFDTLVLHPKSNVQILPFAPVCLKDSIQLAANENGALIISYLWSFGDLNSSTLKSPKHAYQNPGSYSIRLITVSNQACIDTFYASHPLTVLNLPLVDFKTYFTGAGQSTNAQFINTSPVFKAVHWDFGAFGKSNRLDTLLNIRDSVTVQVTLQVLGPNGCSNSKTAYIFISGPLELFFPNAFTPNGDGHNEGFGPYGIDYATDYHFTIYNRWGEIVFKSETPGEMWNGRFMDEDCPLGVYIFTLELRDFLGRYQNYEGSFLLKR